MTIARLQYAIQSPDSGTSFALQHQDFTLGDFDCVIEGATMIATPRSAYDSEAEAFHAIEPSLRDWQLELELVNNRRIEFRLEASFERPVPGKPYALSAHGHAHASGSATLSLVVGGPLPQPTGDYTAGPLTTKYLARLRDIRDGRDKIPATAYFIVTDLQTELGKAEVASRLCVSGSVVDRIRRLSSARHETQGRKSLPGAPPLTDEELAWLERAILVLVRQTSRMENTTRSTAVSGVVNADDI